MTLLPAGIDRARLPFAVDGGGNTIALLVDGVENPHVVVTGGSQTGKTTMLRVIAAYAASLGMIVVVFDPKWRWKGVFPFRLPHVLVYDTPSEWASVVNAVKREMQRRYTRDLIVQENEHREIIKDRDIFPGFLLIADEFGTLLGETEAWWADNKEKEDPKVSPVHRGWQSLLWRGAESGIVLMCAAHMAGADMFPNGTRSRQLHGQRIALGVDVEETSWTMLMGRGRDRPDPPIPDGVRGAGAFLQGTKMHRIQTVYVPPAHLPAMAAHGIAVLRAGGHLDAGGRLRLHTDPAVLLPRPTPVPAPEGGHPARVSEAPVALLRPAQTPPDVPGHGQDTDSLSAGEPDSTPADAGAGDDGAGEATAAPAEGAGDGSGELFLIGTRQAAEYIRVHFAREGYNGERFRKDVARKGVELPSEGKTGNQTIWRVSAVREWYRAAFPAEGE